MSDDTNADNNEITIHLAQTSAPSAPRLPLRISTETTSNQLRTQAADATSIPLDKIRLIFRGRLVAPSDTVAVVKEFRLEDGCVVHVMGKAVTSSNAAAASATAAASGTSAAAAAAAPATAAAAANAVPAPSGAAVIPPPSRVAPVSGNVFSSATSTAAATAAAATAASTTPLQTALQKIRTSTTPEVYTTALQTLSKILSNVTDNPTTEKYRRVKRSNAAFQKRLGGLDGGHDVMLAVGFVVQTDGGVENYALIPNAAAWEHLLKSQAAVNVALAEAQRITSTSAAVGGGAGAAASPFGVPPAAAGGAAGSGMSGMGMGMGGMPGMPPNMNSPQMQEAAARMMSNPAQLQAMLQVRIVYN